MRKPVTQTNTEIQNNETKVTDHKAPNQGKVTDSLFNPGDIVILKDSSNTKGYYKSNTKGYYKEGEMGVVDRQEGDRVWVIFNNPEFLHPVSGNVKRFRKLTKLDKAMK